MNQSSSNNDSLEAIYQRGIERLEAIAAKHKREMDECLEELRQEQIKELNEQLKA